MAPKKQVTPAPAPIVQFAPAPEPQPRGEVAVRIAPLPSPTGLLQFEPGEPFIRPRRDPLHDIIDDILMYEECLVEIAATVDISIDEKVAEEAKYTALLAEAGEKLVQKADSVHAVLTRMEAQRAAGTKERFRIDERNRVLDAGMKRLKEYVIGVMESRNVDALHGETVTLTTRGSTPSVVVTGEVPFDWHRAEIKMPGSLWQHILASLPPAIATAVTFDPAVSLTSEPDKTRIGKALKTGLTVPGAKVKPGRSLQRK
jgi:hypothetical protein